MARIRHPFISNIYFAFQDRDHLYLATEFAPRGDLDYFLKKRKKFKEDQTKFVIASLVIILQYIHFNQVIHRNLCPSNILFDQKGYLRLSDFSLARIFDEDNSQDTSGTPGYTAPEILFRQNHDFTCDYYSLGIIAYQMMLRKHPYPGLSREEIAKDVLKKQVQVKKHEIPEGWSLESADFVNKCMQRKPQG